MSARQSFSLSREPKAVRTARGALERLDGEFPSARLYDASLCLSELVSNAVQHPGSGGDLEMTLAVNGERLRVEVADSGAGFDPGTPTKGDERGWGLFIVDQLADEWGVSAGERNVVWFEIAKTRAGGAADSTGATGEPPSPRDDRLARAAALRLKGRLATP